jgi:hypothetical protein
MGIEMVGANMAMIVSIDMSLVRLETDVKRRNVLLVTQNDEGSNQIPEIDHLGMMFFKTNALCNCFLFLIIRPIEQQYRIKIDGLPYHMTAMELVTELKKQPLNLLKFIETPEVPEGSKTRHFYLVRQAAEKLARKRVYEWHDYPIREDYLVKCQLEYDRVTVTELSSNSSAITLQTENQRLRTLFARNYSALRS